MSILSLRATSEPIQRYYSSLKQYEKVGARHEGAVRTAFRDVLVVEGKQVGWTLVPEWSPQNKRIRIDGAFVGDFRLTHGFWEAEGRQMDWRVEKMRFRENKTAIAYNDFLTLRGIPKEAHRYRLGNRSALEWLVDQYRVRHYNRYDITHGPNNPDDKWYIVRLIKKVTAVSLEAVGVVEGLPGLGLTEDGSRIDKDNSDS